MIRPGSVADNAPADNYKPSWWDFLFGGKPAAGTALNPVKAAVGVFTPEVDAVENAIQPIGPEANLPQGWYDDKANAAQNRENTEGTGSRKKSILIPVTELGPVAGWFPSDVDYNAITLEPRWTDGTNVIESSVTARIAIWVNQQSDDPVILSYNIDPDGIEKNDWTSIPVASIRRVWISVIQATQTAKQPFLVLAFLKGMSLGQGGSVGGGAGSPTQSSSAQSSQSAPVTGGGIAPVSGGGSTPSGGTSGSGGTYTGPTGGTGGGGGGRKVT